MEHTLDYYSEISALRYQLIGTGESMLNAAQYACRHYLGILNKMSERGDGSVVRLKGIVNDICAGLERSTLFRSENRQADVVQKSVQELRMIIDMHLHSLGLERGY